MMDASAAATSYHHHQQQQKQQQQEQPVSPKKSYAVLKSIMPNRETRRPDLQRAPASNHSEFRSNHTTQTVPLLPSDDSTAVPRSANEDIRLGRPSSRSKENKRPSQGVNDNSQQLTAPKENTPSEKHKRSKSAVSLRSLGWSKDGSDEKEKKEKKSRRDKSAHADADDTRSKRPKKTKSTTSLRGLFTRDRSSKDLGQLNTQVGKENLTPSPNTSQPVDTPIWSQFTASPAPPVTQLNKAQVQAEIARYTPRNCSPSKQRENCHPAPPTLQRPSSSSGRPTSSGRPRSALISGAAYLMDAVSNKMAGERPPSNGSDRNRPISSGRDTQRTRPASRNKENQRPSVEQSRLGNLFAQDRNVSSSSNEHEPPNQSLNIGKRGTRVMAAVAAWNGKAKEAGDDPTLDPKSVDAAFEAVLDARNIPENMRQKMRTLTLRVKADFIKQDRGASSPVSPTKSTSRNSLWAGQEAEREKVQEPTPEPQQPEEALSPESKRARARSKTFTFTRTDASGPKKQKEDARPNSIHIPQSSAYVGQPLTSPRTPSSSSARGPQPADPKEFVDYLMNVRDPTKVEVGRLHKLRLLLRNETVAWVDTFITLGGMTEVVDLLHRVMAIEWREEHEDQLLHEALLCLKGLCTTEVALAKLEEMADRLFENLLHLLFDEDKKGPSEFNTRAIIINVLFAYLSAASERSPDAMAQRARTVLAYLTGPKKPEEAQPVSFVLDMQKPRPYRVWCKEVNNVTREVFWIFLHHLNIIPLPKPAENEQTSTNESVKTTMNNGVRSRPGSRDANSKSSLAQSYTKRHFPGDRPPVPAAPYIGGVEWDATTYMTAHLDLLNGLIASLPTRDERNKLREELQASGWEKVMGGTLRTCKEKFYCGVHSGLQGWIAAALEDGWNIDYVRYGPTQEEVAALSPKKSPKKVEPPPQLDIPKLSLGLGKPIVEQDYFGKKDESGDGWLL